MIFENILILKKIKICEKSENFLLKIFGVIHGREMV
jgi:hypothetical protein